MQIRRMRTEDCVRVAEIERSSFSIPWSEQAFLDTLERENYCYLVAVEQDTILGYCGIVFALDEGEIPNICVAAEARRKGVGRAMLEELFQAARDHKLTELFLEVRQSNEAAKQLYKTAGFTSIGIRKGFYDQPKEDAILMKKSL